jgi:hypothetical protein
MNFSLIIDIFEKNTNSKMSNVYNPFVARYLSVGYRR